MWQLLLAWIQKFLKMEVGVSRLLFSQFCQNFVQFFFWSPTKWRFQVETLCICLCSFTYLTKLDTRSIFVPPPPLRRRGHRNTSVCQCMCVPPITLVDATPWKPLDEFWSKFVGLLVTIWCWSYYATILINYFYRSEYGTLDFSFSFCGGEHMAASFLRVHFYVLIDFALFSSFWALLMYNLCKEAFSIMNIISCLCF